MAYPSVSHRDIYPDKATLSLYYSEKSERHVPCWVIPVDTTFEDGTSRHELAISFVPPEQVDSIRYSKRMHRLCAFDSTSPRKRKKTSCSSATTSDPLILPF